MEPHDEIARTELGPAGSHPSRMSDAQECIAQQPALAIAASMAAGAVVGFALSALLCEGQATESKSRYTAKLWSALEGPYGKRILESLRESLENLK